MSLRRTLRSLDPFGIADMLRRRRLIARHSSTLGDPAYTSPVTTTLSRYG